MVSFPTSRSYIYNTFKGIRTRNGIASGGQISATVCQNVEFKPSEFDAGVSVCSSYGNIAILALTDDYADYKIIKGFEFVSEGSRHFILYAENESNGILFEYSSNGGMSLILDTSYNLSATGEANGITMLDSAYNTFIFTNGKDFYAYCPDGNTKIQKIEPKYNGETIEGLAICEQDGSLVIGSSSGVVLASRKGDVTDFDYSVSSDTNKAWYQLFGKPVTAVVPYIDALLVFTEDDSTVLSGNMSSSDTAVRQDASLGGCMSYESWCRHDKYLFFYDNKQKNIYYYMQNNYGQKVLGEPIAPEVQSFFNNVKRLQMVSYIGNDRSEIWLLSNEFKLIYDYYVTEWSERTGQDLTSYFVYNNRVYSTGANKCFEEKAGAQGIFDDIYYPSVYTMQVINLGSYSNMKEMEFQPLISVTQDYNNTFTLDCLINGKKTKTKRIEMYFQGAIWADDTEATIFTPENEYWAEDDEDGFGQVFPDESDNKIRLLKGKFISNWYYLQFTFRTEKRGDEFAILQFELKGITEEYDTTGAK